MSSAPEIWYSYNGKYNGNNPPFYNLDGIDWYDKLKQNLPDLRNKLLTFLKIDELSIQNYFNTTLIEGTGWETVAFMFWKIKNERNINKGRDVFEYFKDIPGITSLSVSILKPNTRIKGHHGDTDAVYRIHIPIYIPAQLPDCGITVAGITKPWIENEIIVFCDACFHQAWNMTNEPRIIIILDVIKEELLPQTDKICSNILSSMKYQHITLKYKLVQIIDSFTPEWIKDIIKSILKLSPVNIFNQ